MCTRIQTGFFLGLLAAVALGATLPAAAVSIDVDLSGQFQQDNDVFSVDFTLDSDRTVSIFTSSWLAAYNGLGFDTALVLWNSAGSFLAFNDDAGLGGSTTTSSGTYAYGEYDAVLNNLYLGAGSYTLTLVQTGNFPNSLQLADGFFQDGSPNYTRDFYSWGSEPYFNGVAGNDPRTGDWTLHLVGISTYSGDNGTPPIPEPTTLTLLGIGAAVGLLRRQRRQ